ncbi:threonylcarbamoyl-AMP synthase [Candidatus Parcubacteria bacterium]|jgi:L-threonylcarbamoyladenylate synthase|nr:MAG: threonylcarbamoyl-AMP synthase [Candidatus Parcubacteria bacterium]
MDIISVKLHKPDPVIIKRALGILSAGGVVVYPTDTAYGLAVDAANEEAIGKIFIMKQRIQKALPVLVENIKMAQKYTAIDDFAMKFLKRYWPAAVTFILPSKQNLPAALTLGLGTLGIRQSTQKIAQALVASLGRPITSTSANISGAGVFYSGQDVARHFGKYQIKPDLILDAGEIPEEPPSTIVDLTCRPPKILRKGRVRIFLGRSKT